jgi:phage FluMu protein Com
MTHLDDIRCKHCNALVALVARVSIVGRTPLECQNCKVIFVVHPIEKKPTRVYTLAQEVHA